MKVTFPNDKTMEFPLQQAAHGYICKKMEITPQDIRDMRVMALNNPEHFQQFMHQLEARFQNMWERFNAAMEI